MGLRPNQQKAKSKNRRVEGRINKKSKTENLRLVGVNAAGIKSKMISFEKVLSDLKPGVVFLQETKSKQQGNIVKSSSIYESYELIRKSKSGGGLFIGVAKELNPAWLAEGNDDIEFLSVMINLNDLAIRCVNAYGPQENDLLEKKVEFWTSLDSQVEAADIEDTGFILQMDGNLWAGTKIVPGDPNKMNKNGEFFADFLSRHPNLSVVNSLGICKGLITRRRQTRISLEQSVLDFFVVCDRVSNYLDKMIIDEERNFSLTNFSKKLSGERSTDTDHMTLILDLEISVPKVIKQRVEFYNLKNTECQETFKKITTNTENHSKCFSGGLSLEIESKRWEKSLKASLAKSFKKVRLSGKMKKTELKIAVEKRSELRNKLKVVADNIELAQVNDEIENVEDLICNLASSENTKKVRDILETLATSDGMFSQIGCWKVKRKMFPKNMKSVPSAKMNNKGRLISSPEELKVLYSDTYKHRLRHRPIKPGLEFVKKIKDDLCQKRLDLVKLRRQEKWSSTELNTVLKSLKFNKSRDPHGLVNEIFQLNVIGADLEKSLLMMFKRIKMEF